MNLPDEIRFITIHGVPYYILWEHMLPGCSFFLKTVATAAEVNALLPPYEEHLNMELKAHTRCEFGYYGVRVWRLA